MVDSQTYIFSVAVAKWISFLPRSHTTSALECLSRVEERISSNLICWERKQVRDGAGYRTLKLETLLLVEGQISDLRENEALVRA